MSVDIPLADFVPASDPANLSRNSIAQIVLNAARADNASPVEFFLDNNLSSINNWLFYR